MNRLTKKEEEIMNMFWEHGPMFVRELLPFFDEPKPHYNTLSTIIRTLEEKGYIQYKAYGNTYQYFPSVDKEKYKRGTLKNVVSKYFDNSYTHVVSAFIEEEKLSISELKALIKKIENQ